MPFLAPLIPAVVASVGGAAVGGAINGANQSSAQKAQQAAAQQAAQQAQTNATNALNPANTPQVAAANAEQQRQSQFANAAGAVNGLGNQQNVFNTLGQVASGQGPNPALAMLNNATGANTANQAALMAGQRGAGANSGLIARQAAQQGAANQQNAAGQGAALQANQSLGALSQMGGIAGQQVGQQLQANSQAGNMALGNQGQALGLLGQANSANTQLANTALQGQIDQNSAGNKYGNQLVGGVANGIGAGLGALSSPTGNGQASAGSTNTPGNYNLGVLPAPQASGNMFGVNTKFAEGGPVSKIGQHFQMLSKGGKAHGNVPALVSPGEKIIPKEKVKAVAEGKKDAMSAGKAVPGKPKVGGAKNSYANDTVHKNLSEGDIVLPRSVTQSSNPHWAAHQFVSKIMAEKGLPTRKPKA